ncbi:hypothetical protein EVAR_100051_1 [Eumeta japonica]|uniref:Uncharacterized protein n=1 Tax=Eumeta variegata TaxID=151549 RepID=A0A4C1ZUM0_EUMVA|nr:hypothetical protein EVAR_100051_1 [Eumeta japonica]
MCLIEGPAGGAVEKLMSRNRWHAEGLNFKCPKPTSLHATTDGCRCSERHVQSCVGISAVPAHPSGKRFRIDVEWQKASRGPRTRHTRPALSSGECRERERDGDSHLSAFLTRTIDK